MQVVEAIYALTEHFPATEKYSLVSQMRRAAVSAPSNIAEGYARSSTKELIQFVSIALGSHSELDTQLEVARRLSYLVSDTCDTRALIDKAADDLQLLRVNLRKHVASKNAQINRGAAS